MARPSKLTDAQWEQIGKRLLSKESTAAELAREFKISKGLISQRFSKRIETVKSVANQIVATDQAISLLNPNERIEAFNLADDLRAISGHLAGAARYGASTAHRAMGIANNRLLQIDDSDPLSSDSVEAMKGISVLTRMANESASIGLNLLNANKDTVIQINNNLASNKKLDDMTEDELLAIAAGGR